MPEVLSSDALLSPLVSSDDASAQVVGQGPRYSRITVAEIGLILELHAEGKTETEIAQRLGKHQTSIGRVLRRLAGDSTPVAQAFFKARAYRSAVRLAHIAEKGRAEDAIKAGRVVLTASGVLSTDSAARGALQVAIVLGVQVSAPGVSVTVQQAEERSE